MKREVEFEIRCHNGKTEKGVATLTRHETDMLIQYLSDEWHAARIKGYNVTEILPSEKRHALAATVEF